MGSGAGFFEKGIFNYKQEDSHCGVKLLIRLDNGHKNCPMYSHSSKMYAHRDTEKKVTQIAVYENRVRVYDIDWGHDHDSFKKGEIHIQYYKDGHRDKSRPAEKPTPEQVQLVKEICRRWNNEE
ncbi:MAG: hypothetical protein IKB30_02380 [Clostridia bacterium]|nr:hypothetical protein [Clostridia bacterium]